jgi:hypothetical protein
MNRWTAGLALVLAALGHQGCAQVSAPQHRTRVAAIEEARLATLGAEAQFWRDGARIAARELIVIRVRLTGLSEFMPRAMTPPLFVVDDTVAVLIRGPLGTGEAVLVAPRGESLWLTERGVLPQELTLARISQLRAAAALQQRAARIPAPRSAAPQAFADLPSLIENQERR